MVRLLIPVVFYVFGRQAVVPQKEWINNVKSQFCTVKTIRQVVCQIPFGE